MKDNKQKGQLVNRGEYGYYGRYYINQDGRRRRVCVALKANGQAIFDKARARYALARLIAENTASKAAVTRRETFRDAAERVLDQLEPTMITVKDRRRRLERFVYPHVGAMDPRDFKKSTVLDVLRAVRDAGKSKATMKHVWVDMSVILQDLVDSDTLPKNVARFPKKDFPEALPGPTKRSKKIRAVLNDSELAEYLAWEHPEEKHRLAVRERQVMSCVARILGGLRTGDLHTIRWEAFGAPDFQIANIERQKRSNKEDGGELQEMVIPEMLKPHLKHWWIDNGSNLTGLIFPKLRGKDAGEGGRKHSSHAKAFKRDLRRMWGIDQQATKTRVRSNGRGLTNVQWTRDVRPMTPREAMLLTDNHPRYLPVDFHSWRRAAAQAIQKSGVNTSINMTILSHRSEGVNAGYRETGEAIVIPAQSLPLLPLQIGRGHTGVGTIHEQPRVTTPTPEEPSPNPRGYSPVLASGFFYTPAVAGSIPVPPTKQVPDSWGHEGAPEG